MRHSVWFWLLALPLCGQAQDIKIIDPATGKVIAEAPAQPKEKPESLPAPAKSPPEKPTEEDDPPKRVVRVVSPMRGNALLKLPVEVRGDTDDFIRVTAETEQPIVQWYSPDKGLKLFPAEALKDTKTAICFSKKPGRYRLVAVVAKGDIPSPFVETTIIVGDAPGPGPDPGPGPGPAPEPTDPLTKAILTALHQETASDKVASTSALADLYTAASVQVKASTLSKVSDYHTSLKALRVATIGDKIPLVRAEVTKYLDSVLPRTVDAPLNDTNRNKCSQAFTEVAYALRACCP